MLHQTAGYFNCHEMFPKTFSGSSFWPLRRITTGRRESTPKITTECENRKNAIKCRSNWNNWNHWTRVGKRKKVEKESAWNNAWHSGHILSAEFPLGVRSLAWDRWFASSNRRNCFFVSLSAQPRFHPVCLIAVAGVIIGKCSFCAIESRGNCFAKRIDRECCGTVSSAWLFGAASRRLYFGNIKSRSCDFFVSLCYLDWRKERKREKIVHSTTSSGLPFNFLLSIFSRSCWCCDDLIKGSCYFLCLLWKLAIKRSVGCGRVWELRRPCVREFI